MLKGCLGFETRFMFQVRLIVKIRHVGATAILEGVQAVARQCVLHPGIRFTTEGKTHGKILSQGSRKVPAGYDSVRPHGQLLTSSLDKAVGPGLPSDASGNVGQATFIVGIYLPSCRDKR